MTRGLLWSTPGRPERTLAFAAIGTGQVIGLVGAHNLTGLAGATADDGSWLVSGPMRADAGRCGHDKGHQSLQYRPYQVIRRGCRDHAPAAT